MPWVIKKNDDEWCVYKEGPDGEATGDTLGCHDSDEKAKEQLAALYASEAKALRQLVTFEIPIEKQRGYEIRAWGTELEVSEADGLIRGYASVFDVLSEPMGNEKFRFRERIRRGAFTNHLAQNADVRALWQHNPEYVLGRTKNKTLTLIEDIHGLRYLVQPPDTTWARDFYQSIKRGDVDQSSFTFKVVQDKWDREDGQNVRTVYEAQLYDVSPVTFPAYIQTSVGTRSVWMEVPEVPAPESGGNSRTLAHLRRRLELAEKI